MNLTPELFEQVVNGLCGPVLPGAQAAGEAVTAPRPSEQRRGPRVGVKARIMVLPLTERMGPVPFAVPVRDLSPGGIGFLHRAKIDLDEQLVLLLPTVDGGSVALLCTVAYWQPLADNLYAIGARFTRVLRQGTAEPTAAAVAAPRRAAS